MPTGRAERVEVVVEVEDVAVAKVKANGRKVVAKAVRARVRTRLGLSPGPPRLTGRGSAHRVGPGDIGQLIVPRTEANGRQAEVGVHLVVMLGSVTMNMMKMRLLGRRT